jgi:CheY-like chemotaxis protein
VNKYESSILLVEDNPMDVDLTLRAFARHKLINPVDVARDGEEALAYFKRWDEGEKLPVVILLDLNLPKVSGLEVLEKIKKHPRYYTIPVVVITTSAEDKDIERAYKLGANSYIVKPVDFDKFMEISEHIEIYWAVLNTPLTLP